MGERSWARLTIGGTVSRTALAGALERLEGLRLEDCLEGGQVVVEDPEAAFKRIQGMIDSMTKDEKHNPDVINAPRRRRIAAGAGLASQEVAQFLSQFKQLRAIMQQMS